MNENIALILSLLVIAASAGTVVFYKNKYSKQLPLVSEPQDNSKEIELLKTEFANKEKTYSEKIKQLELNQAITQEERRVALEKIVEQEKIIAEKSVVVEPAPVEVPVAELIEEKTVKSILVVDDSMVVRNKMKKLLEGAGYDITTANDGLEALIALPTKDFSLVITDLEMPNLDGFGLIMKLDANPETKGLPIMAITGHEEMKIRVSECGGLYSIHKKPWKDHEILKKVELLSSINVEKVVVQE
jgi:CheY-like chemotaxis protein/uncharacterized protein YxeA